MNSDKKENAFLITLKKAYDKLKLFYSKSYHLFDFYLFEKFHFGKLLYLFFFYAFLISFFFITPLVLTLISSFFIGDGVSGGAVHWSEEMIIAWWIMFAFDLTFLFLSLYFKFFKMKKLFLRN